MISLTREEFAADRGDRLGEFDDELRPVVADALVLYPTEGWETEIVDAAAVLWLETYEAAGGDEPDPVMDEWRSELAEALARTSPPDDPPSDEQIDRITYWVTTDAANGGTVAAADTTRADLEWLTRNDEDVRDTHRAVHGQTRAPGRAFNVGGYELFYPGQPVGPPEIWLNCRCLLYPVTGAASTMNARKGRVMVTTTPTPRDVFDADAEAPPEVTEPDEPMPWHGVLAPEGVPTGDKRMFAIDALTHRDLPIPLRYVPVDSGQHNGAVIVGNIQRIWREGNLVKGEGAFHDGKYANEAVDLIAQRMLRGVSVDLDDIEVSFAEDEGDEDVVTSGRISAATLVAIPAFAEAYVTLGTEAEAVADAEALAADGGCLPCQDGRAEFVSDKPWSDFTQADYTDDQWFEATCLHRNGNSRVKSDNGLPIREPSGTLNRNGVHAAASRFNQTEGPADAKEAAARCIRGAYSEMNEEPPEAIAAVLQTFAESVEVGDSVTWQTTDDEGEIEEHAGTVTAVSGDMATVEEGDDLFEVPVVDLTVVDALPQDGDGEAPPFPPESSAETAQFAPGTRDGPGWLTNPEDSQRLRNYWTRGAGAAKIRWGAPGDFNRCRRQLAKYIQNPQWLAGTCANLHKVALGTWPGEHAAENENLAAAAPPFTLVASTETYETEAIPFDASALSAPRAWFQDPKLDGPTAAQFVDEGPLTRIYGHMAAWDTCHTGIDKICRTPPHSQTGYAYFATGVYLTVEGETVPVGSLTLDTGHAPGELASGPAIAHYDNTGSVAAYVAVGEDDHGIWFSGIVAPWLDEGSKTRLRGATLSGDWRTMRGSLELVAALAVNVPGFPIPRTSITASAGTQKSLVAAGILTPVLEDTTTGRISDKLSIDEVADALFDKFRQREIQRKQVEQAMSVFSTIRTEKVKAARELLMEGSK